VFDGQKIEAVADTAYVPLVAVAKSPSGDGESYEDINLINPKRKEGFIGTESDLVYQLGCDGIKTVDKVEIKSSDGKMSVLAAGTDYTVDLTLGKVTFVKAQPAPLKGEDNIFVTYTKETEGYKESILSTGIIIFSSSLLSLSCSNSSSETHSSSLMPQA
jgi:hypothetical protein